jgi:hypothetical protein
MRMTEHDSDSAKGAVEQEAPTQHGNSSLRGQLGHRTANEMIKENDSDFPEPGGNPEHTGEPEMEAGNAQTFKPAAAPKAKRQKSRA